MVISQGSDRSDTGSGAGVVPPRARTARERARAQIESEIIEAGRRHLASQGAPGLSLRAIARELGFTSSAVYRYVASRDELLTELIVVAYDELGAAAEGAAERSRDLTGVQRWVAVASAMRTWAVEHPHEWALLYGSPVPGYAAPERTVDAGTRASRALLGVLAEAHATGWVPAAGPRMVVPDGAAPDIEEDLRALGEWTQVPVEPEVAVRIVGAWAQVLGLISLEVFGQTRNLTRHDAALFDAVARSSALSLGLSEA